MGREEDRECESGPPFFFVDVCFREDLRSIYDFVGCDSLASYRVRCFAEAPAPFCSGKLFCFLFPTGVLLPVGRS
jgi:hypothetical protein